MSTKTGSLSTAIGTAKTGMYCSASTWMIRIDLWRQISLDTEIPVLFMHAVFTKLHASTPAIFAERVIQLIYIHWQRNSWPRHVEFTEKRTLSYYDLFRWVSINFNLTIANTVTCKY